MTNLSRGLQGKVLISVIHFLQSQNEDPLRPQFLILSVLKVGRSERAVKNRFTACLTTKKKKSIQWISGCAIFTLLLL